MKINVKLSHKLIEKVKAREGMCYKNALDAFIELSQSACEYVEGFVLPKNSSVPIGHGWLEYQGKILEFTPSWVDLKDTEYFPGLRWNSIKLSRVVFEKGEKWTMPLISMYEWGKNSPGYVQAATLALEEALRRVKARTN